MRFQKVCSAALVSAALCFSSTQAVAASSCQAGGAGCLLPFQAAPPVVAQPVQPVVPVEPVGVEPLVAESAGIGLLPILLGLAAAGLLLYLLLDDDEEEVISV